MVIAAAVRIASTVFKYRKYIYRTLVAQDRAIDKAFKIGGYGRQTRYGARHGIVAGTVLGSLINNQSPDSPGNGISTPFRKRSPPSKSYQTRSRQSVHYSTRCRTENKYGRNGRQSNYRRY